jgi:ABC-type uncharacterized transport system ATPase subunit
VIPALQLTGISKRFGKTEALRGVDFTLAEGEIHALLGENGAGKTTLMNVAYGLIHPDAGSITVRGTVRRIPNPGVARMLGIGMVHQHFTSIPAFTVQENIALAASWPPRPTRIRARLESLMDRTGVVLDPGVRAEALNAGLKQRLEVLLALATDARILLLDEPSSVFPPQEAAEFLGLIRSLRAQGVSSVLITHKLQEALSIADRVTVLRRGEAMHTGNTQGETPDHLATLMLGEAPATPSPRAPVVPGTARARLTDVRKSRIGASGTGLRQATFQLRSGEVVGVAAIEGNGQDELLRLVAGLATPDSGTLEVEAPVAFIPGDRSTEGMIQTFTLTENLVLARGRDAPWVRGPWLDWRAARRRASALVRQYNVQPPEPDVEAWRLSGGNQQRMIIAAALDRDPAVLVAENPTRGLDLRATGEVHLRLREAAARGAAVLVYLPDLDELLELADRLVVLARGVLSELPIRSSREEIGQRLLGVGNS